MQTPKPIAAAGQHSLNNGCAAALDAQCVDDLLAAGTVSAKKYDSITSFSSFQGAAHALASGAWGRHLDKMGAPHRVVGLVVRREQVHAALALLGEVQARIGRLGDGNHQRAVADQGVEDEQTGSGTGARGEGADDAHGLTPFVYQAASVLREPGSMWEIPNAVVVAQICSAGGTGAAS